MRRYVPICSIKKLNPTIQEVQMVLCPMVARNSLHGSYPTKPVVWSIGLPENIPFPWNILDYSKPKSTSYPGFQTPNMRRYFSTPTRAYPNNDSSPQR